MSAFLVSAKHVKAVVGAYAEGIQYKGDTKDLVDMCNILWRENHKSVDYRYSEKTKYTSLRECKAVLPRGLTWVDAYSLAQSLEYQSCETPDYEKSEAGILLQKILDVLVLMESAGSRASGEGRWSI